MNDEFSQLPWDQLQRTEDGIPWPAMRTFAEALATNRALANDLFDAYDRVFETSSDPADDADLYVPAIFALAAPRLDDEQRREIGSFLVKKLVAAGYEGADVAMEVLTAAAGTLGPVILPAVLDAIAGEPDTRGAWLFLWSLTKLVAQTKDQDLRSQVVHACVSLLERADRGAVDLDDAGHAAWTLALLGGTEYTGLLQRLAERTEDTGWRSEYEDALKLLQHRLDFTPPKELWEEPVEEWLTPRWNEAQDGVEEDEDEEYDRDADGAPEDPFETYTQLLLRTFLTSPVAAGLPPELLSSAHLVIRDLVYPSLKYLHKPPRAWDEAALRELLLDFVPRDLPADREMLAKIVPITEALLYWLRSEGMAADADDLAATIRGWSEQIITRGMDPKNWGPVKTFLMEARQPDAGTMTKTRVMEFFNRQIAEAAEAISATESLPQPPEPQPQPKPKRELPIPIVERAPAPARNAPCPCGSGKKYKKCHGRPGAELTSRR